MSAEPASVLVNEGQRLLCELPSSLTEIAASLNVRRAATVLAWRSGKSVPGPNTRTTIHRVYGIPPRAWHMPARDPGAPPLPMRRDEAVALDALQHCLELLDAMRTQRLDRTTTAAERIKLAAAETKVLSLRQRLEEKAELSEDRYVREHPAWRRARAAIVDALREHPAASKAVVHALGRVGL